MKYKHDKPIEQHKAEVSFYKKAKTSLTYDEYLKVLTSPIKVQTLEHGEVFYLGGLLNTLANYPPHIVLENIREAENKKQLMDKPLSELH